MITLPSLYWYNNIYHVLVHIIIIIYYKAFLFHSTKNDPKIPKYKRPFSKDYKERGSHARGVYSTHDTSRMETVKMKQEEKPIQQ